MNFKVCLVLSLAVLVLAVCVSADRAHVERVKGAPNPRGGIVGGMSKGDAGQKAFSEFVNAIKTPGARLTCDECKGQCQDYCAAHTGDCNASQCPSICCFLGYCPNTPENAPCTMPGSR